MKKIYLMKRISVFLFFLFLAIGMNAQDVTLDAHQYKGGYNISCHGQTDGIIDATPTGGTAPYTFSWSNGATTEDVSSLAAGSYTLTVTDAASHTISKSVTLYEPDALSTTLTPSNYSGFNISYFGGNNGEISTYVAGGAPPYSYLWSNSDNKPDQAILTAGSYSVTVIDQNGCTWTQSTTLSQPDRLEVSYSLSNHNGYNVTCANSADGNIDITPTGGATPYNYSWSTGDYDQDLSNKPAGVYNLTIYDNNGNELDTTITLTSPAALDLTLTKSEFSNGHNTGCYGCSDGSIAASYTGEGALGGLGGSLVSYTYSWSNGQTGQTLTNVGAGTYSVTVTDNHGCATNASAVLTDPAQNAWGKTGNSADSTEFMGTTNAAPMIFKTNGSERLRLTSAGNMGIGVSNPQAKLDVNGDFKTSGNIAFSNDRLLSFTPATSGVPALIGWGTPVSAIAPVLSMPYCLAPTPATVNLFSGMTYSYGNNVNGGQLNVMRTGFDGANGIIDMAGISNGDAPNLLIDYYCGKSVYMCTGVNGGNVLMTAATLGKVGIGTDNPTTKLDVNGDMRIASLAGGGTSSMVQVNNDGVLSAVPVTSTALNFWQSGNSGTDIYHTAGKVGIGTNAPADLLQVGDGTNRLISGTAGSSALNYGTSYIGFNADRSAAGSWTVATDNAHNGGAVMYANIFGDMYFSTIATSGTTAQIKTDAEILNNVKLFIAANGNIGIGTTSTGSYKLSINGNVRAKDIVVQTGWSDFVFNEKYMRMTLLEKEAYYKKEKHLPNIDTEKDITSDGLQVGKNMNGMMQNIEENTLDLVEIYKKMLILEQENAALTARLNALEKH